jgi:hypothetical protein
MTEPSGCEAPPAIDFDAVTFGGVPTDTDEVELLFALFGSAVGVVTVAVLLMAVPADVAGSTTTSSANVATAPVAIGVVEQTIVPFVPAGGVVHDQPACAESAVNRSGAGSTSVIVTLAASLGPLFVTTIV